MDLQNSKFYSEIDNSQNVLKFVTDLYFTYFNVL